MKVALSGDPSSCLACELAPGAYLVAVARGFGNVAETPVAAFSLARLKSELERRLGGERFARARRTNRAVLRALAAAYARVNADVHSRTAGNEDYVAAACSMTCAVVTATTAYLAHAGSTAAYMFRNDSPVELTKNDAVDADAARILTRAVGCGASLSVSVCSVALQERDTIVLSPARLARETPAAPPMREVRFVVQAPDDEAPTRFVQSDPLPRIVRTIAATLIFYAMLCLA